MRDRRWWPPLESIGTFMEWRLGTRGVALLLIGVMWIGRGMVIAHDPGAIIIGQSILHLHLPVWFRVGLWTATGAAALLTCGSHRWQQFGWGAIMLAPAERALSYGWSMAMWAIPGYPPGTGWSIFYVLWWVANVALLIHMSRWSEDSSRRLRRLRMEGD